MSLPKEYDKYNLTKTHQVRRRLVATSEGGPGMGKSRLGYMTMPRPLLVIQGDMNDEHLRENVGDELGDTVFVKEVFLQPFIKHDEEIRSKDHKIYTEIRNLYKDAVMTGYFRSVMIDEGSWLYMMVRRSFLLELGFGGERQQSYASVNQAMDRFFTMAKQHRINLYIPHRQTDEREEYTTASGSTGSRTTGNKKVAGWKDSLYTSQIHLVLGLNPDYDPAYCSSCGKLRNQCKCKKFTKQPSSDRFVATIAKCSAKASLVGRVLVGDEISWPFIGQLVFPNSEEKDWV